MEEAGRDVKALESRPILPTYAYYYFETFQRLHRTRSMGMSGVNPISTEAVVAYNTELKEDFFELFDIITGIDSMYLKAQQEVSNVK